MNYSTEGGTAPVAAVHRLPRSQGIAYVAAFVVEALFTIIGNLVVLAVFGKNSQLRRRKSHWLLINQAVADLLAVLILLPSGLHFFSSDFDLWQPNSDFYVIVVVDAIVVFLIFVSLFNLLMIALERTYATYRPIKHRVLSARSYRVAMAVVWFLPVLPIFPRVAKRFTIISLSTFYSIHLGSGCGIFLLLVSSYTSIWIKFKRRTIHRQNDLRAAQERKLTASLFLAIASSFVTYLSGTVLASVVQILYSKSAMSIYGKGHAYTWAILLFGANSLINPIIYSLKMPGFRRAAIRLICGSRRRTANAVLPLQTVQRSRRENVRPWLLRFSNALLSRILATSDRYGIVRAAASDKQRRIVFDTCSWTPVDLKCDRRYDVSCEALTYKNFNLCLVRQWIQHDYNASALKTNCTAGYSGCRAEWLASQKLD